MSGATSTEPDRVEVVVAVLLAAASARSRAAVIRERAREVRRAALAARLTAREIRAAREQT